MVYNLHLHNCNSLSERHWGCRRTAVVMCFIIPAQ